MGTVWDSVREANSLQDVFTMQLCPPRESTLFPGTFLKQGGYMVRVVVMLRDACVQQHVVCGYNSMFVC